MNSFKNECDDPKLIIRKYYHMKKIFLYIFAASITLSGCNSVIPKSVSDRLDFGEMEIIESPLNPFSGGGSPSNMTVIDLKNKVYKRNQSGCGDGASQSGNRPRSAVLSIIGKNNLIIKNAHFDCSTQNTIFVSYAKNLILDNVSAWNGSDNAIEIRDSEFVIVKNSTFGKTRDNKCIETENSIVVFYNVILHDCLKGFAGERTSEKTPELIFFINTTISLLPDDRNYDFICDSRVSKRYGIIFLEDINRSSRNVNCVTSIELPEGLIIALLENNLTEVRRLLQPIYEKLD